MTTSNVDSFSGEVGPRVVAVAFVTQGHINPLFHFCVELANRGIDITFVTIRGHSLCTFKEIPAPPQHLRCSFDFASLDLEAPKEKSSSPNVLASFFQSIEDLDVKLEELLLHIQSRDNSKVSCILSDYMHRFTQVVAKKLGIPRAAFRTGSLPSIYIDYHVPLLLENGDIPVTGENWEKIVTCLPGLNPRPAWSLPIMYHAGNLLTTTDPGYRRKIARTEILKDDAWILANSIEELEPATFEAIRKSVNKRCVGVGPLLPGKFARDDAFEEKVAATASVTNPRNTCLEWLDAKSPQSVLYISFGSAVNLTLPEFEELARGLESSMQAFLWVLRPDSVEKLDSDRLDAFKAKTRSRGLLVSWAPQVEVLSHESTGGFVTHCGWNSVFEGICSGVPMLGWPKEAEQNLNCEFFVESGVGLRLTEERYEVCPKGGDIAAKIAKVLEDKAMKSRAKELKVAARKAMEDEGGSSRMNIEAFVSFLKGDSSSGRS